MFIKTGKGKKLIKTTSSLRHIPDPPWEYVLNSIMDNLIRFFDMAIKE
jgi:hypothetical protein